MRDAMGGVVVLIIIVVFIVVALGYAAFNVNYTKAFRMKNKIVSVYEDYNGKCSTACQKEISAYATNIGYKPNTTWTCSSGQKVLGLYCVEEKEVKKAVCSTGKCDIPDKKYYTITTRINLTIPIISNVFDFQMFEISGDTKALEVK